MKYFIILLLFFIFIKISFSEEGLIAPFIKVQENDFSPSSYTLIISLPNGSLDIRNSTAVISFVNASAGIPLPGNATNYLQRYSTGTYYYIDLSTVSVSSLTISNISVLDAIKSTAALASNKFSALDLSTRSITEGNATTYITISGSTQTKGGGLNIVGSVGIGTINPGALLDVTAGNFNMTEPGNNVRAFTIQRSGNNRVQVDTTNDGFTSRGNSGFYWNDNSGTDTVWMNLRSGGLTIGNGTGIAPSSGAVIMGNVGAGTTSPSSPLHVRYRSANTATTVPALILDNPTGGSQTVMEFRTNNVLTSLVRGDNVNNLVASMVGTGDFYIRNDDSTNRLYLSGTTGNVGIGNVSPGSKLEVTGNASISNTVAGFTTNILESKNSSTGLGARFEVSSSSIMIREPYTLGGDNKMVFWGGYSGTQGENFSIRTNDTVTHLAGLNGRAIRLGVVSGLADNNAADMAIISGGNVGIGTTSPDTKFHVFSGASGVDPVAGTNTTFEHSGNHYVSILSPNANENGILFGSPQSNVDAGIIYNTGSPARGLQFRTGGNNTRMVVDSGGNVGIGTTAPNTGKLEVIGNTKIQPNSIIDAVIDIQEAGALTGGHTGIGFMSRTYSGSAATAILMNGSSTHFYINGTKAVSINPNRDMGIGTAFPEKRLHVEGDGILLRQDGAWSSGDQALFYLGDTASYLANVYDGAMVLNANTDLQLNAVATKAIYFRIGDVNKAILDTNGNVGIGITSPLNSFQVGLSSFIVNGSNGRVGIGISTPSHKFDVFSNYYFSSSTVHGLGSNHTFSTYGSTGGLSSITINGSRSLVSNYSVGYSFSVGTETVYLTHLGAAEDSGLSIFQSGTRDVGIYNSNGVLLSSSTIQSSTPSIGSFRYTSLPTSITLEPNLTYTLMMYLPSSTNVGSSTSAITMDTTKFTYTGAKSVQTSALAYASTNAEGGTMFYGPGMRYTSSKDTLVVANSGIIVDTVVKIVSNGKTPNIDASYSILYSSTTSGTVEGYWMDGAGNTTLQTPHDKDTGEWIFYSENVKTGRQVRVNMEALVHEVEKLSGKKFMKENMPLRRY